jgi:DNA phosphorothioation-dependent restriction protein DptG
VKEKKIAKEIPNAKNNGPEKARAGALPGRTTSGFLIFCHPYGRRLSICQLCMYTYRFAIANNETPTFLPLLMMWHATQACQRGSAPESHNLKREKTYLPLLFLSLLADVWVPHVSFFSDITSQQGERRVGARA